MSKDRSTKVDWKTRLLAILAVIVVLGILEAILLKVIEHVRYGALVPQLMMASGSILLLLAGLVTAFLSPAPCC